MTHRLWGLTPTEEAIIGDVLRGHCSLELLAAHRKRSRRTVQCHLANIYDKMMLSPRNMTAMVLKYLCVMEAK